jgi:hypothetical protein
VFRKGVLPFCRNGNTAAPHNCSTLFFSGFVDQDPDDANRGPGIIRGRSVTHRDHFLDFAFGDEPVHLLIEGGQLFHGVKHFQFIRKSLDFVTFLLAHFNPLSFGGSCKTFESKRKSSFRASEARPGIQYFRAMGFRLSPE